MSGKRTKKINEGVDPTKLYALGLAIGMVKERAVAKFDETIEISMNLGVDPRHADQMVRGVVNLPNGTGRDVRVAVFARGAKADEAKAAGADIVGAEDLVDIVQGGKIDFDRVIATQSQCAGEIEAVILFDSEFANAVKDFHRLSQESSQAVQRPLADCKNLASRALVRNLGPVSYKRSAIEPSVSMVASRS
jgi:hypothetical protein